MGRRPRLLSLLGTLGAERGLKRGYSVGAWGFFQWVLVLPDGCGRAAGAGQESPSYVHTPGTSAPLLSLLD